MLREYQIRFLELLVARDALRFGDFTLKSGRRSPYFINTGCFHRASDIAALGACYAACVQDRIASPIDVVFGPAYKGIPLALACAQALHQDGNADVGWCYDRKETKDHGDGGNFVGAPLTPGSRVLLVDDVLTAGTALRATLAKLQPLGLELVGAVISVDREETGPAGNSTARLEIEQACALPIAPIIGIRSAIDYLHEHALAGRAPLDEALYHRIRTHLDP